DQENGRCPISAITLIFDYRVEGSKSKKPKVFTFLLRDYDRYPQQKKFEENLDKFMERVHEEFDHKFGDADYNILFFDSNEEMLISMFKIIHLLKPDFCE